MSSDFTRVRKGLIVTPSTLPTSGQNGAIAVDSTTNTFKRWSGTAWVDFSGGGGTAGKTYFEDTKSENINKFDLYNDGASATPVDGIGGTVNSNWTKSLNTTSPILDNSSYRLSKGGAINLQGHGASVTTDVALDVPVKEGQPITVQFRYRTSASYSSGWVAMFAYLVGPNILLPLTGLSNKATLTNELEQTDNRVGMFTASLSATDTTTAIRIIAHMANTTTTNFTIDFDEIFIGTAATLTAPIVTSWRSYVPTFSSSFGTPPLQSFWWRRVGENLEIRGFVQAGTISTGIGWISLPPGFTIDTTKVQENTVLGVAETSIASTTLFKIAPTYSVSAGNTRITLTAQTSTNAAYNLPVNLNVFLSSGERINISVQFPINQFTDFTNIIDGTQVNFSNQFVRAVKDNSQSIGTTFPTRTTVIYNSVEADNFSSYNASTGVTTIRSAGFYFIGAGLNFETTASAVNEIRALIIQINGTGSSGTNIAEQLERVHSGQLNSSLQVSTVRFLQAGDTVNVAAYSQTPSPTVGTNPLLSYFNIMRLPELSAVGLAGQRFEIVQSRSASDFTPANSARWNTLIDITLTPGVWMVIQNGWFFDFTGSSSLGSPRVDLSTQSVTDSVTEATFDLTDVNVLYSGNPFPLTSTPFIHRFFTSSTVTQANFVPGLHILRVLRTTTIRTTLYVTASTPSGVRMRASMAGLRLA